MKATHGINPMYGISRGCRNWQRNRMIHLDRAGHLILAYRKPIESIIQALTSTALQDNLVNDVIALWQRQRITHHPYLSPKLLIARAALGQIQDKSQFVFYNVLFSLVESTKYHNTRITINWQRRVGGGSGGLARE